MTINKIMAITVKKAQLTVKPRMATSFFWDVFFDNGIGVNDSQLSIR